MTPTRTAIVGGGMLGLTVALRLAQRGDAVTVLEAGSTVGGLAAPWTVGEIRWDRHYHVTLASDRHLRALLAELGLDDDLEWKVTSTGYFDGDAIHPVSGPIDFLRLPSLTDARQGPSRVDPRVRHADPQRAADGGDRGRRVVDSVVRPVDLSRSSGSLSCGPSSATTTSDASAAFIWATIQRLTRARRNGLAEERFGYVPGGYERVLERPRRSSRSAGGRDLHGVGGRGGHGWRPGDRVGRAMPGPTSIARS